MSNEILKEGKFDCDVFSFEDYQDVYSLFDFIGCFDNGNGTIRLSICMMSSG